MTSLHKVVTYTSAGGIRKAEVYIDLSCSLFRVNYNDGESWKHFPSQEQAESSASAFVHFEEMDYA
jgi:hypothetical protein